MTTLAMKPKQTRPHIEPRKLLADGQTHHPSVMAEAQRRASNIQLKIADAITAFAGSMKFVYVHIAIFALWMLFFEKSPWPTLTLVVSLEAIFLSTFVMIGQNRQAAFQQVKADHDFSSTEKELDDNTVLTRQIAELATKIEQLTSEIHKEVVESKASS
ncbi:MAG: putative rane protein [Microbacteriaceae bacterium]|jgi:uncharacterized membrane protein|nr:putative rane protein [Microbacteriaceae bacterium]